MGVRKWDDQEWHNGTIDQRMCYPEPSLFSGGAVKEGLCAD